jgi:myo-inositol-1(or 4)-monophosphatase
MVGEVSLSEVVRKSLDLARLTLIGLGEDATNEVWDERVTDISTLADRAVSAALIDFFKTEGLGAIILSEESGSISIGSRAAYTIAIDDIDGTDNFHRGREILPYCTVVSVFEGSAPVYKDTLAAGVMEHRSGRLWIAERGRGTTVSMPDRTDHSASASQIRVPDRRSLVVVDQYSAKERSREFNGLVELAWVKDFGSSALHLAGVASGLFDAYINLRQKAHELGAGYLLVKEAGGIIVDLEGASLDDRPFAFDEVQGVVAAGTREMATALLELCTLSCL